MLAGECQATVDGRRFTLHFLGPRIVVHCDNVADAIWARRLSVPTALWTFLRRGALELEFQVGRRRAIRIFPQPSFLAWALSGQVRAATRTPGDRRARRDDRTK